MGEFVTKQPETYQIAIEAPTPHFLPTSIRDIIATESQGYSGDRIWRLLSDKITRYMVDLKSHFPDYDECAVEATGDLLFGHLRTEDPSLSKRRTNSIKESNARIQHTLTHGAFYASLPETDSRYAQAILPSFRAFEKLSRFRYRKYSEFQKYWTGIRAETGVVRALTQFGFNVHLPRYTQDCYGTNPDLNEVLQWDVFNGVDLVAVKNGVFYLIDSKGRGLVEKMVGGVDGEIELEPVRRVEVTQAREIKSLPPAMEQFAWPFNNGRTRHIIVNIPTTERYLSRIPDKANINEDPKQLMAQFGVSTMAGTIADRVRASSFHFTR